MKCTKIIPEKTTSFILENLGKDGCSGVMIVYVKEKGLLPFYFCLPQVDFNKMFKNFMGLHCSEIEEMTVCENQLIEVKVLGGKTFNFMSVPDQLEVSSLEGLTGRIIGKDIITSVYDNSSVIILIISVRVNEKLRLFWKVTPAYDFKEIDERYSRIEVGKTVDLTVLGDDILDVIYDEENHVEL